jgi:hydrophobic/amphiphilic exporter-1 (mainly G- bacteria), HAE1 family
LIPLVFTHGPGAVGSHTIGWSSLGGMLFGTVFGVIIVPGLYYIFGSIAEGRTLIRDEEDHSLTEGIVHKMDNFPVTEEEDEKEKDDNHHA